LGGGGSVCPPENCCCPINSAENAVLMETRTSKTNVRHEFYSRCHQVRGIEMRQSRTVTVLSSVYCCRPYSPISLPMPDCLNPPNGAPGSKTS